MKENIEFKPLWLATKNWYWIKFCSCAGVGKHKHTHTHTHTHTCVCVCVWFLNEQEPYFCWNENTVLSRLAHCFFNGRKLKWEQQLQLKVPETAMNGKLEEIESKTTYTEERKKKKHKEWKRRCFWFSCFQMVCVIKSSLHCLFYLIRWYSTITSKQHNNNKLCFAALTKDRCHLR